MNTDTFFEQFDSLIELPGSMDKLRTMILELAFSGRLTERTNRTDGENDGEWDRMTVGEAAVALNPGFACSKQHQMPSGHVHLRTHNVATNGRLNFDTLIRVDPLRIDAARGSLKAGDVIFNNTNSQELVGKTCFVDADYDYGFSNHLTLIRLSEALDPRFFVFYFNLLWRRGFFAGLCNRWIGQAGINTKALAQIEIPAPPLAEQRRIVAKVDQLMALCDELEARQERKREGREQLVESSLAKLLAARTPAEFAEDWHFIHDSFDELFDAPKSIGRLREAIVEIAISGMLSPQSPTDGNAAEEIERIRLNRQSLIERGEVPKQPAMKEVDPAFCPFDVPDSWQWARFGDLCLFIEAGWSPQCESRPRGDDEWGVLKISAVTWGRFDPRENKALPRSTQPRPECEVRDGDFLMTRANTVELVARSVVVSNPPSKLLLNDKTLRVRFPTLVDKRYVNLFNNSSVARSYYRTVASGTSESMRNVSRESILSMPIAVPPYDEQRRIVESFNRLRAWCDQLEEQLSSAATAGVVTFVSSITSVLGADP